MRNQKLESEYKYQKCNAESRKGKKGSPRVGKRQCFQLRQGKLDKAVINLCLVKDT